MRFSALYTVTLFACLLSISRLSFASVMITELEFAQAFSNWADNYQVNFASEAEQASRYQIFKDNLQTIAETNTNVGDAGVKTLCDTNVWASKTVAELNSVFSGVVPPVEVLAPVAPGVIPAAAGAAAAAEATLPATTVAAIAAAGGAAVVGATAAAVIAVKRKSRKQKEKKQQQHIQDQLEIIQQQKEKEDKKEQLQRKDIIICSPTSPKLYAPPAPPMSPQLQKTQSEIDYSPNTTPQKIRENLKRTQELSPNVKILDIMQRSESNTHTQDQIRSSGGVDILQLTPKRRRQSITARKLSYSEIEAQNVNNNNNNGEVNNKL